MPKRNMNLYINDIYSSCGKIIKYVKGCDFSEFKKDGMLKDAIIRNIEIIGEASQKIPAKIKKEGKNIPWTEIRGMRNRVTHEYFGIDESILWKTVQEDIPNLKKEIYKLKKALKDQTLF